MNAFVSCAIERICLSKQFRRCRIFNSVRTTKVQPHFLSAQQSSTCPCPTGKGPKNEFLANIDDANPCLHAQLFSSGYEYLAEAFDVCSSVCVVRCVISDSQNPPSKNVWLQLP